MRDWDPEFQRQLLGAASLPEALALFCPQDRRALTPERSPRPLSYSELSRRMGLRSRSHVREIAEGLKPAPKNFPHALSRALRIQGLWARYLELLSQKPATAGEEGRWSTSLRILRGRLRKSLARREFAGASTAAGTLLGEPELPAIFAALGDAESGASVPEIEERTRLAPDRIERCLVEMQKTGAVERKGERFLAVAPHLIFREMGAEEYFQQDIARNLEKARARVRQAADKENTLFLASTFCVSANDLPRLREELRQLLTRYVDSAENPHGNRVVSLLSCLF